MPYNNDNFSNLTNALTESLYNDTRGIGYEIPPPGGDFLLDDSSDYLLDDSGAYLITPK